MIDDAITRFFGQGKSFDVEAEAVQREAGEDIPGGLAAEGLKAALGILEPGGAEKAEAKVEDAAVDDAKERLAAGNDALAMAAAADDNVGLITVEHSEKLEDEAERYAEIGIHEKDDVARGGEHAGFDREALAASDGVFDDADARVFPRGVVRELSGIIDAFFDNDDDLGLRVEKGLQRLQSGGKAGGFVPAGNDEADARSLNRHRADTMPVA